MHPRIQEQIEALKHPPKRGTIVPITDSCQASAFDCEVGKKLCQEGKVGAIIIAGGQGTRLGLQGEPKGSVAVSVVKHKSLFQIFLEKRRAAGLRLPLAFMTSPFNDKATRASIAHLGEEADFFMQGMLPFLDKEHRSIEGAYGPDGNGLLLHYFHTSGLLRKWSGVEFLMCIPIDNPLADPFDYALIGACVGKDVALRAIEKERGDEQVGVFVQEDGHLAVVEYMEQQGHNLAGARLANINCFCFSMPFVQRVKEMLPPLHAVEKHGVWKFERFLFDLLCHAKSFSLLLSSRKESFSPLKNTSGPYSIETVRAALQRRDADIYERLSGLPAPSYPFELAQEFYYPSEELKKKWKGRLLPDKECYIEA